MLTKPSESIEAAKLYSSTNHIIPLHTGDIELVIKLLFAVVHCTLFVHVNADYSDHNLFSAGIVTDLFHSAICFVGF